MKNIKYFLFIFTILLASACRDDILDTESQEAFTEDFIYNEVEQLERLVFTAYNSTRKMGHESTSMVGSSV